MSDLYKEFYSGGILNPFFGGKNATWDAHGNSGSSTAEQTYGITPMTNTGYSGTARNVATTNIFTRARRKGYVTSASAPSTGFNRITPAQHTIGTGTKNIGGFLLSVRFGISDAVHVATARMFVGMQNSGTASNVDPATLTNSIGVGCGASETTMKIYYGGSAAQTPIDLGSNFPCNTVSTDWYWFQLFAPSNNQVVHYRLERMNTGHVANGTLSGTVGTVIPAATTLLMYNAYRTNNSTPSSVGVDVSTVFLGSEA